MNSIRSESIGKVSFSNTRGEAVNGGKERIMLGQVDIFKKQFWWFVFILSDVLIKILFSGRFEKIIR